MKVSFVGSELKLTQIPVPLASNEVEVVSRRARDRWFQQDSSTVAAAPSSRSSSPTIEAETVYAPALRSSVRGGQSPSLGQRASQGRTTPRTAPVVGIRDGLDHNARCANCNEWIMGRRFQCANCPSDPVPYNLCSICELRSYRVHDPKHVFFKFDRPVHIPLQSPRPLLPILVSAPLKRVPLQLTSVPPPRRRCPRDRCDQPTRPDLVPQAPPAQGDTLRHPRRPDPGHLVAVRPLCRRL
jgi:hypothetical protein